MNYIIVSGPIIYIGYIILAFIIIFEAITSRLSCIYENDINYVASSII